MAESRLAKFLTDQQEAVAILRDAEESLPGPYSIRLDALNAALFFDRGTSVDQSMADVIADAKKVEAFLKGGWHG